MGFDEGLDGGDVLFLGDEEGLGVEGGEFVVEFGEEGGVAVVVNVGVDEFGLGGEEEGEEKENQAHGLRLIVSKILALVIAASRCCWRPSR